MLPSTPQVESVYLDPDAGVLAGLKEVPADTSPLDQMPLAPASPTGQHGDNARRHNQAATTDPSLGTGTCDTPHTLLIDQTTLDPTFAMTLAEKVQSETLGRALMLDAPVSGGESCLFRSFGIAESL